MTSYRCAHCGEPSSLQGHFMAEFAGSPPACPNAYTLGELGFHCRVGHTCPQERDCPTCGGTGKVPK